VGGCRGGHRAGWGCGARVRTKGAAGTGAACGGAESRPARRSGRETAAGFAKPLNNPRNGGAPAPKRSATKKMRPLRRGIGWPRQPCRTRVRVSAVRGLSPPFLYRPRGLTRKTCWRRASSSLFQPACRQPFRLSARDMRVPPTRQGLFSRNSNDLPVSRPARARPARLRATESPRSATSLGFPPFDPLPAAMEPESDARHIPHNIRNSPAAAAQTPKATPGAGALHRLGQHLTDCPAPAGARVMSRASPPPAGLARGTARAAGRIGPGPRRPDRKP
jgi:hypothetical protein